MSDFEFAQPLCVVCYSYDHTVSSCPVAPCKPPPAGSGGATRVVVERRPAYTITLGKRRKRFATKGAAYYALAKRLVGAKYMGPLASAGYGKSAKWSVAELSAEHGLSEAVIKSRADRAVDLFVYGGVDDYDGEARDYFDSDKWQAYVRRVAKKLRALDEYAARRAVERLELEAGGGA